MFRYAVYLALLVHAVSVAGQADPNEPQCDSSCYWSDATSCVNGECVCKDAAYIYYPESYECALPVGTPCNPMDPSAVKCPSFAYCASINQSDPMSTQGICSNGIGRGCNSGSDCNPGEFLACMNQMCRCDNPLHTMEKDGKCWVKSESKGCSNDGVAKPRCEDPNSECDATTETCICKQGSMLINGRCEMSILGQPCKQQWECGMAGLECKNRKCQCMDDSTVYDQELKICRIQLGDRCDSTDLREYWRAELCMGHPNAKCAVAKGSRSKINVCQCDADAGFTQSTDPATGLATCSK